MMLVNCENGLLEDAYGFVYREGFRGDHHTAGVVVGILLVDRFQCMGTVTLKCQERHLHQVVSVDAPSKAINSHSTPMPPI